MKFNIKTIAIIAGVVLALGTGAYFVFRPKKNEESSEDSKDPSEIVEEIGETVVYNKPVVSSAIKYSAPSSLNTKEKIKQFQNYVLSTKKDTTILGKSGADGIWGENSQKAFDKYGSGYLKYLADASKPIVTNISPATNADINTIIGHATGELSEKDKLSKMNRYILSTWAKAIKSGDRAFVSGEAAYRTKTGQKILAYNPISAYNRNNKSLTYKVKRGGQIAYSSPSDSSSTYSVAKYADLGKAKAIDFNNGLWLYLPEKSSVFKWYKIDDVYPHTADSWS